MAFHFFICGRVHRPPTVGEFASTHTSRNRRSDFRETALKQTATVSKRSQLSQHFEQVLGQNDRRVLLHLIGSQLSFVTTKFVLFGCWQIAVSAVGELNQERVLKRRF